MEEGIEKATFALGCFWGPDDYFSKLEGVISTRVGYTGGKKKNPTYESLGDHTESIEIVYNPTAISYSDLLEHFWNQHDPTEQQKTQYMSAIFPHNEKQQVLAENSLHEQQLKTSKSILTKIIPASTFYEAEEYHQKYFLKQKQQIV